MAAMNKKEKSKVFLTITCCCYSVGKGGAKQNVFLNPYESGTESLNPDFAHSCGSLFQLVTQSKKKTEPMENT